MSVKIAFVDNYDSFSFNFVNLLEDLGKQLGVQLELRVFRNNKALSAIKTSCWDIIVIGPGPGRPSDAGDSMSIIESCYMTTPILGICLGMQCLNEFFHGKTLKCKIPVHGKIKELNNLQIGITRQLPQKFKVARYHSLAIEPGEELDVLAYSDDIPMIVQHKKYKLYGVQFHPESFMGEYGIELVKEILKDVEVVV